MTLEAFKSAPIIAADKSLPSRFNVVGMLSGVLAINPVTMTVSDGNREYHLSSFSSEASKSGSTCCRGGLSDGAGSTLAACSKIFKKRLCPVLLRLNNWHDVFLTVRLVDLALPVNTQLRCDAVSHR